MKPLSGKGSQQTCWVKLPFLCLIAVTLVFAMVVLIAPLVSTREAKLLSDDPSRQLIRDQFKIGAEMVTEVAVAPKIGSEAVSEPGAVAPMIEKAVVPEVVPAKVEEEQAATGGSNLLRQLPFQQGRRMQWYQCNSVIPLTLFLGRGFIACRSKHLKQLPKF